MDYKLLENEGPPSSSLPCPLCGTWDTACEPMNIYAVGLKGVTSNSTVTVGAPSRLDGQGVEGIV